MNTNLKTVLETAIGDPITSAVSGTGKIRTKSGAEYFLKSGAPSESYVCEAEGLKELSETGIFRTPKVLSVGTDHLLTEYVPNSAGGNDFFEDFGRRLARLHRPGRHISDSGGTTTSDSIRRSIFRTAPNGRIGPHFT